MPKGPKGDKAQADVTGVAVNVMKIGTGENREELTEKGKDTAAVSLGQRGGKARAESLTQKQRTDIAKKAARSRWGRKQS